MTILKAEHISYSYRTKYQTIEAVRDVSCKFDAGKMYAVTGESGSGKSTLLSMLAGLDLPQSGRIYVQGKDLAPWTGIATEESRPLLYIRRSICSPCLLRWKM